jgi:hypothetical protein
MFGTISHFRVKPGHEEALRALQEEWEQTMRPSLAGLTIRVHGYVAGRPNEMVNVVLMQDEDAYRGLAARPDQDEFFRRVVEHLESEPTFEDVAWEGFRIEAGPNAGS